MKFAAVIGHADTPAMLEQCISHHLNIGVTHVFVSLNDGDKEIPACCLGNPRVRAVRTAGFAGDDPFGYFSECARQVTAWAAPDWILFMDSDEFWLPQGGRIGDTRHLDTFDLLIVERFNTPLIRKADGSYGIADLTQPQDMPLVSAREYVDDAYLAGDARTPWIMALDAPKLMVRPDYIESVGPGAHSIHATDPNLRWLMPEDLLIIHAPFTGEARFRGKMAAIRKTFNAVAGRLNARQAWHWRYWLSLDDAALTAEFQRQSFRESALAALRAQGVLATGREQFGRLRAEIDKLQGDILQDALCRAIGNYVRPDKAAAAAPAFHYAPEREVDDPADCYFYHCMDIPGHGEVTGQWDLRGQEQTYLGNVTLAGKTVLEIGTASGFLAFWMEAQGATVTSFDLDEQQSWDLVPFASRKQANALAVRQSVVRRINNSWWFTRRRLNAKARMIYGTVYGLDRITETFDVVTVNSVLLHLRDPFQALAQAAARTHGQIVVTDVAARQLLGEDVPPGPRQFAMHFLPRFANNGPDDTWWIVPETLAREFLQILGFKTIELTYHRQRFMPDEDWYLYTLVGTR